MKKILLAMLIAAASLAGVPFTVGFFGKFFIFESIINQHFYGLAVIGIVTVASGFYYYFKVIRAMYWMPPAEDAAPVSISFLAKLVAVICAVLIVVLGCYPQLLIQALP